MGGLSDPAKSLKEISGQLQVVTDVKYLEIEMLT